MSQLELFVAGLVLQAAHDLSGDLASARLLFRAPPIRGHSYAWEWVLATREVGWLHGLTPIPPSRTWLRSTP